MYKELYESENFLSDQVLGGMPLDEVAIGHEQMVDAVVKDALSDMHLFVMHSLEQGEACPVKVKMDELSEILQKGYDCSNAAHVRGGVINQDYEYEARDIDELLHLRLEEEGVGASMTLMPSIAFSKEMLSEILIKEQENYREGMERAVMTALNLNNKHWIGLIINLNEDNEAREIQLLGSMTDNQFEEIKDVLIASYGDNIDIKRQGLKQEYLHDCGPLAVENLIRAVKSDRWFQDGDDMLNIRAHHVELLEADDPYAQFYFRQSEGLRSFEYEAEKGLVFKGGIKEQDIDLLLQSYSNLTIALHGGMIALDERPPFTYKEAFRKFIGKTFFVLMTRVTEQMGLFFCGYFYAKLSDASTEAGALILPIRALILAASRGVTFALAPRIGMVFKQGNSLTEIGNYYRSGLILGSLTGLAATGVMFGVGPFLKVAGINETVADDVQGYFTGLAPGALAITILQAGQQVTFMGDKSYLAAFLSAIDCGITISLGYAFVFGKWGLPNLGVIGYGYATSMAAWVDLILLNIVMSRMNLFRNVYKLFNVGAITSLTHFRNLWSTGWPISLNLIAELSTFIAIPFMANGFFKHERPLDVLDVAAQYNFVLLMPLITISQAMTILVAQARGMNNYRGVRIISNLGLAVSAVIPSFVLASYLVFPDKYISAFLKLSHKNNDRSDDEEFWTATYQYTAITMAVTTMDAIRNAGVGCLRGYGYTKVPAFVGVGSLWGIGLLFAYLDSKVFGMGINGLVTGLGSGFTVGAGIIMWLWLKKSKQLAIIARWFARIFRGNNPEAAPLLNVN